MAATLDFANIGSLIECGVRRARWAAFVERLHRAADVGGPLEGWVFHGTESTRADWIEAEGVATTHAIVNDPGAADDEWSEAEGSHWGTAAIAAFHAEDLIESLEDPGIEFAIVAVPLAVLETFGRLASDGQMIDCPIFSRLEVDEAACLASWEASDKGWAACLKSFGSVVLLAPVPASELFVLRGERDLDELLETVVAPASAGMR